jgi:hypothetical protein
MALGNAVIGFAFACRPSLSVRDVSSRRLPRAVRACAAHGPDEGHAEAVECARSGDFRAAARALRVAPAVVADADARRGLVRQLLNPVSLDKLKSHRKNKADGGRDTTSAAADVDDDGGGVVELYETMKAQGLLPAFGSAPVVTSSPTAADKAVSVERLVSQAGLPLSALAPKKTTLLLWQLAGIAAVTSIVVGVRTIGHESWAGPTVALLGTLFFLDQTVLRGLIFEQAYGRLNSEYSDRIVRHEAGHLLCGYLSGLSISGYVLSGAEAFRDNIPGQAGTLFFDARMSKELQSGTVTNRTIDRYSCVLMAGIAAEAIEYGQAEGGAGDEAGLVSLLSQLSPPWSPLSIKAQARWAVLQAILLLRTNKEAHQALFEAMKARKPLGDCIDIIERLAVAQSDVAPPLPSVDEFDEETRQQQKEAELKKREERVVAELSRVRERLNDLERRGNE